MVVPPRQILLPLAALAVLAVLVGVLAAWRRRREAYGAPKKRKQRASAASASAMPTTGAKQETAVGECTVHGPYFERTAGKKRRGKKGAAPAKAAGAGWVYRPGRIQYDEHNGYCGETSIQVLMLEHGVWVPQETARAAGGSELLLGLNYDKALRKLGIVYEEFAGRGYEEFMRWTKQKLQEGRGVVTVAYIRGGPDSEYDHIMPIVAYKACPTGGDSLYVHSNYDSLPVERKVADYSCTRSNKKDSIDKAGCVPRDTRWGYAILGPAYAGIGPPVELFVEGNSEPGLGKSTTLTGRVRVRGLQAGQRYVLHRVGKNAPKSPRDEITDSAWSQPFTAAGEEHVLDVTFKSGTPAHFICVAAAA